MRHRKFKQKLKDINTKKIAILRRETFYAVVNYILKKQKNYIPQFEKLIIVKKIICSFEKLHD